MESLFKNCYERSIRKMYWNAKKVSLKEGEIVIKEG
jgi:hypothetical protein